MTADAYATAPMVMPIERAKALVESIPELSAYWIIANGPGVEEQTSSAGRHIFIYFSIFILMKSPHTFKLTYANGQIYFSFLFSGSFIWGQVKIGDNVEVLNPAAVLELEATDKGLLLPRLTNQQRDSIELNEASEGLLIFNVDTNEIQYLKRHSSL